MEMKLSDRIMPIGEENLFKDAEFFQWCSSIIKGEDGKYHLFYSRWKKEYSFCGWLTHSTVAHAVSDCPAGPYGYVSTVLDFAKESYEADDMITAHNPKIKYFDGKYYLYFCSTHMGRGISNEELIETAKVGYSHPNWKPLRVNQRTFVATADCLDGPFTIQEKPLLEPSGPITTLVVNPAVTKGHDGKYYLIIKGDKPGTTKFERNQAVAISDYPDKGFVMQEKPVIQDWDTEDMSLWYDENTQMYYAVFHAHTYIGMMVSVDGRNWRKSADFTVMEKRIEQIDGSVIQPDRLERPFIYVEDGVPKCISLAVQKNADAYIAFIPLTE